MTKKILILPGDGIGQEVTASAKEVLDFLIAEHNLDFSIEEMDAGGTAYDKFGSPLPEQVLAKAKESDAILFGAVGGPKWDDLDWDNRPEQALLSLRKELELFANLRPAFLFDDLAAASPIKNHIIENLDILIVRELTGCMFFGKPRGIRTLENGEREGYNTYVYSESEIRRIARVAFESAQKRNKKLCSVDKANVLEVTVLWREILEEVGKEYLDVELSHMYVDNAAMQLVRAPKQFDVMVTGNMFGDILSDAAAMLTGSIGMLPSASLDKDNKGMYEPCHGSAPDIAGQGIANPLATILSAAMMLRYSLNETVAADAIEEAVSNVLDQGLRTADIYSEGMEKVSTEKMGEAVVAALKA